LTAQALIHTLRPLPAVMAAADEIAVGRFLAGALSFPAIPAVIERVMQRHHSIPEPDLEAVLEADRWSRAEAAAVASQVAA